jgi:hypothetical protein
MASERSQQISRVFVPEFNSTILRTTGYHVIGIESNRENRITVATQCSQQVARAFAPESNSLVPRTTGYQLSGIECNRRNKTTVAFQRSQQIPRAFVPGINFNKADKLLFFCLNNFLDWHQ